MESQGTCNASLLGCVVLAEYRMINRVTREDVWQGGRIVDI